MFSCTHSHFIIAPLIAPFRGSPKKIASSHVGQRTTQLLRGPEERILRGLFGRVQNLAHGAQLQPVVVLQLEHHPFTRGQLVERAGYAFAELPAHEVALRVSSRASIGHLVEDGVFFAGGVGGHGSVFLPDLSLAEVIETEIGDDAVNPGVERALEAKTAYILVGLEEGLLEDVLGVMLGSGEVQGKPQYGLVVMANQFLEGGAIAALRLADQHRIVDAAATLPSHVAP